MRNKNISQDLQITVAQTELDNRPSVEARAYADNGIEFKVQSSDIYSAIGKLIHLHGEELGVVVIVTSEVVSDDFYPEIQIDEICIGEVLS